MAIYHYSVQVISRSTGRSAVAAAAYRAGTRLRDERTNRTHDYSRKPAEAEIMAPHNAPVWVRNRQQLWNAVEAAEKRADSQLAREVNMALPKELTREQAKALVRDYVREQFVERGMVADVAWHWDADNPHAHVMLTTRELTPDGFGKKAREWNAKDLLVTWRERWAEATNRALARAGEQARVDHRSLEAQGIDRVPTIHEGPVARKGVETQATAWNRQVTRLERAKAALRQKLDAVRALVGHVVYGDWVMGYLHLLILERRAEQGGHPVPPAVADVKIPPSMAKACEEYIRPGDMVYVWGTASPNGDFVAEEVELRGRCEERTVAPPPRQPVEPPQQDRGRDHEAEEEDEWER